MVRLVVVHAIDAASIIGCFQSFHNRIALFGRVFGQVEYPNALSLLMIDSDSWPALPMKEKALRQRSALERVEKALFEDAVSVEWEKGHNGRYGERLSDAGTSYCIGGLPWR